MFCPNCKKEIKISNVKFCPVCGFKCDQEANSATPGPEVACSGFVACKNILDNPNITITDTKGAFSILEHNKDLSSETNAFGSYFRQKMGVRLRQLLVDLENHSVRIQAGGMQWMAGSLTCDTGLGSGIKAVGGFLKGFVKGLASNESTVKPRYSGSGHLMLEPTYKHIILINTGEWGEEGIVLQDGLFLACDDHLKEEIIMRKKISGLLAGEGLFNLCVAGEGVLALESPVPYQELYEFDLQNGVLKIDGNMAIAWSKSLTLTVERSSKGLVGSMVNKEGLVNVFRGTGKVLMTPVVPGTMMEGGSTEDTAKAEGGSATKSVFKGLKSLCSLAE